MDELKPENNENDAANHGGEEAAAAAGHRGVRNRCGRSFPGSAAQKLPLSQVKSWKLEINSLLSFRKSGHQARQSSTLTHFRTLEVCVTNGG